MTTAPAREDRLLHAIRPLWTWRLPWEAADLRGQRHWEAAVNLPYTAALLGVAAWVLRHIPVHLPVGVVVAVSAVTTIGLLKVVRLRLATPDDYTTPTDDEGDRP